MTDCTTDAAFERPPVCCGQPATDRKGDDALHGKRRTRPCQSPPVAGLQTAQRGGPHRLHEIHCALTIAHRLQHARLPARLASESRRGGGDRCQAGRTPPCWTSWTCGISRCSPPCASRTRGGLWLPRSEERRVGKECVCTCRSRRSPEH